VSLRIVLVLPLVCSLSVVSARATTLEDASAALAAARKVEEEAMHLGNRWVPAETALAAAQAAIAAKDYEAALAHAREAEALARLSVQQAVVQQRSWRDAVPR
jgi:hypothetical protein